MAEQYRFLKILIIFTVINIAIKDILITIYTYFDYFNSKRNEKNNANVNYKLSREEINYRTERVLDEYGDNILRIAYSYMHNMSEAEDILQETLIQYINNNSKFESQSHEKAWLLRVAINLSKNKIKYNKRRETLEIDDNLFSKNEDDIKFVWDAVKDLPQKYEEVIHLFYYEEYTTSQIADMLSKNESTIRSLLRRGRCKLKEILREEYDFDE